MKKKYEQIDFSLFTEEAEDIQSMTAEEKERVLKNFYETIGIRSAAETAKDTKSTRNRSRRRSLVAAACACLVICTAFTPIGERTWAAAKEMFMGIGEFLGMSRQDSYATEVNQTQSRNGVTVTLCEAIGSDNEMRFSFQVTKDGEPVSGGSVFLTDASYNGYNGMKTTGYGNFGSDLPKEERDPDLHYLGASFEEFEMPVNPTVDVEISACGENFNFNFVLKNKAFKEATKRVAINQTVVYRGTEITLKELVITPIDQWIIAEAPDFLENNQFWRMSIYGTDQDGDPVNFNPGIHGNFRGSRDNDDETTYQLDYDVKSYTLRVYDDFLQGEIGSEETAVSEPFTVRIPEK